MSLNGKITTKMFILDGSETVAVMVGDWLVLDDLSEIDIYMKGRCCAVFTYKSNVWLVRTTIE